MPRKPRPLERDSNVVRDASLIVIASEDSYAAGHYFGMFRPRRVQFRVLPAKDGLSAPQHIVARLDDFRNEYQLNADDELWYCGDTDHWITGNHLPNLHKVLQHCDQHGYKVALSNPCFELWFLLHFLDLPPNLRSCDLVCGLLSEKAGYSKARGCQSPISWEMVHQAVARAKKLDEGTGRIPESVTTRVHQILDQLIKRESIVPMQPFGP